jgi:hypothetical protein
MVLPLPGGPETRVMVSFGTPPSIRLSKPSTPVFTRSITRYHLVPYSLTRIFISSLSLKNHLMIEKAKPLIYKGAENRFCIDEGWKICGVKSELVH